MRVLIVDDHPVTRLGLKMLLGELNAKLETVEVGRLSDAIDIGERGQHFDLVLLDVRLPDGNGIERLQRIKAAFEATPIVIMSAEKEKRLIRSAIEAGAAGYIPKDTAQEVTVNAWRLVLASGMYLPPEIVAEEISSSGGSGGAGGGEHEAAPALTDRQLAVLQRLLLGDSNKLIARQLDISEGAVKMHLAHIFDKLNVSTRLQAMAKAQKLGYFEKFGNTAP
jgi:DNA-binding NarL/FixJ family response regulator